MKREQIWKLLNGNYEDRVLGVHFLLQKSDRAITLFFAKYGKRINDTYKDYEITLSNTIDISEENDGIYYYSGERYILIGGSYLDLDYASRASLWLNNRRWKAIEIEKNG